MKKILKLFFTVLLMFNVCAGPIHDAVKLRNISTIKLLLTSGVDINSRDQDGKTVAHLCVEFLSYDRYFRGKLAVFQYLLENGANVLLKNNAGITAYDLAGQYMQGLRRELNTPNKALIELTARYHRDRKRSPRKCAYLKKQYDNQVRILKGLEGLKRSTIQSYSTVIEILKQAKKNSKNIHQKVLNFTSRSVDHITLSASQIQLNNKLLVAVKASKTTDVRTLLQQGANVDAKDPSTGKTAMHFACEKNDKKLAEILLVFGAYINAQDNEGKTPIHYGLEHAIRTYVTSRRYQGRNIPSLRGSYKYDENVLFLLRDKGADWFDLRDLQGQSVYDIWDKLKGDVKSIFRNLINHSAKDEMIVFGSCLNKRACIDLLKASFRGDVKGAISALSNGANPNVYGLKKKLNRSLPLSRKFVDVKGLTPFHLAVRYGHSKIVNLLFEKGADIDALTGDFDSTSDCNATPIHFAISCGHQKIALQLIKSGADVTRPNGMILKTPLYEAVEKDFSEVVRALLKYGASSTINHTVGPNLSTALHLVRSLRVLKLLLAYNPDPYKKVGHGYYNANNSMRYQFYSTPREYYLKRPFISSRYEAPRPLIDLMVSYEIKRPIFEMVKRKDFAQVRQFLSNSDFIDKECEIGSVLFHWAALNGCVELVQILIDKGIDINNPRNNGNKVFYEAIENGYVSVVKLLFKTGVNIDNKSDEWKNALSFAHEKNYLEIIKFFESLTLPFPSIEELPLPPAPSSTATTSTVQTEAQNSGTLPPPPAVEDSPSLWNSVHSYVSSMFYKSDSQNPKLPPVPKEEEIPEFSTSDESAEFNIDSKSITLGKYLGGGSFGHVYKAKWNRQDVAVKQLIMRNLSEDSHEEFEQETKIWSKLHHPAICALYGICIPRNPGAFYCMVMALKEQGSLQKLLKSKILLSWNQRNKLAIDIASALGYLHGKKIIHRDLKSLNVLIEKRGQMYRATLTDFGLSEVKDETESTHTMIGQSLLRQGFGGQAAGTILWMAPELLRGRSSTKATDIWAYGMVLLELATRKRPFKGARAAVVPGLIKSGELPEIPEDTPVIIKQLIKKCWDMNAKNRPTIEQVLRMLPTKIDSDLDDDVAGTIGSANRLGSQKDTVSGSIASARKLRTGRKS